MSKTNRFLIEKGYLNRAREIDDADCSKAQRVNNALGWLRGTMKITISLFEPRQRLFDPYRSPTLIEGAEYSVMKGRRLCDMSLLDDSRIPKVGVRWSTRYLEARNCQQPVCVYA